MNTEEFWSLIDQIDRAALEEDAARAIEPLERALGDVPLEHVVEFQRHLESALDALETKKHARAAGDDGESDDAFLYARAYVVARGRAFYQEVLANPRRMPSDGQWAEELLLLANEVYERRSGEHFPGIEFRRKLRPLEYFALAAHGADYRTNRRVNLIAVRVEHEFARAEPSVLAPFVKLALNFNVSDSRAAANATGFVHEGIALVESGAVFDETFNVASDTELLAAVGSILARVKRCLVEQLGFDSPPFDAIVERIITGGAACTERVEALTRKIVGRKERVAFEYRLDATGTRLTAILEDAETGGAISTATVLEADYPMSLRGLTRWQSPRVNARDRTIEIRDRKRKIERVIRFES